jgi:hypothetical protein
MRNDPIFRSLLLVTCGLIAGCSSSLDTRAVQEFVDKADDAARKRYAPDICGLRGKDFVLHLKFQGHESRFEPTEVDMDRKLFCKEAGNFARYEQYRLERKSIYIDLADDRKTAIVKAQYVETMPYYEPGSMPRTMDDFWHWQIVESNDESVVGIEDGDLVFLSARVEAKQSLIPKKDLQRPWN